MGADAGGADTRETITTNPRAVKRFALVSPWQPAAQQGKQMAVSGFGKLGVTPHRWHPRDGHPLGRDVEVSTGRVSQEHDPFRACTWWMHSVSHMAEGANWVPKEEQQQQLMEPQGDWLHRSSRGLNVQTFNRIFTPSAAETI